MFHTAFKFMVMSSVVYGTRLTDTLEVLPSFDNSLPRFCLPFPEHCFQELLLYSIPEVGPAHSAVSRTRSY